MLYVFECLHHSTWVVDFMSLFNMVSVQITIAACSSRNRMRTANRTILAAMVSASVCIPEGPQWAI